MRFGDETVPSAYVNMTAKTVAILDRLGVHIASIVVPLHSHKLQILDTPLRING